mgnify:CR=1 FL=1
MHEQQFQFVQAVSQFIPNYFDSSRVLEIGSLDINGSVRVLFSNCEYIGIDIGSVACVDLVIHGQDYAAPSGYFDTVIS